MLGDVSAWHVKMLILPTGICSHFHRRAGFKMHENPISAGGAKAFLGERTSEKTDLPEGEDSPLRVTAAQGCTSS